MFLKNHFSVTANFCRPNRQKANWRPSWVGNVVHVQRRHHQVAQKDSVRLPWPAPGSHYRWPRNIHWPPETEARPTTQANQTTTTDRNQGQRATAEKKCHSPKTLRESLPLKGSTWHNAKRRARARRSKSGTFGGEHSSPWVHFNEISFTIVLIWCLISKQSFVYLIWQ